MIQKNLTNSNEIIKYLKEIKVEPYYIQGDYIQDLVENEQITEEQMNILSNEPNLKEQVNAVYVPKELVELPDEIIQAIKSAKKLNIAIDDFCIDWSVGINDYDFEVVVMNWLQYTPSPKERYEKVRQVYCYATQNWDNL